MTKTIAVYNKEIRNPNITCLEYAGANFKSLFKCTSCRQTFRRLSSNVIRGHDNCPHCGKVKTGRTKKSYNDEIKDVGLHCVSYLGVKKRSKHKCLNCTKTFYRVPSNVLRGRNTCPHCSGINTARTLDSYNTEIAYLGFVCLKFTRVIDLAPHKCKTCKTILYRRPSVLLNRLCTICINCRDLAVARAYYRLLSLKNIACPTFTDVSKRYPHRCLRCNHEWSVQPRSIRDLGTGCPACASDLRVSSSFKTKSLTLEGKTFLYQGYEGVALAWLLERGCNVKFLETSVSKGKPVFDYCFSGNVHTYTPDIYHTVRRIVIEVKSVWTLTKTEKVFKQNCEKAKAVLACGYTYTMMLMNSSGLRLMLPKHWYLYQYKAMLEHISNGEFK